MSSTREPGYYWVKWEGHWAIADFINGCFIIDGISISETNLDAINETRILNPDEVNDKHRAMRIDATNDLMRDAKWPTPTDTTEESQ